MSIYPEVRYQLDGLVLTRTEREPGKTTIQTFQLVATEVTRTDCYCCSCPETGFDLACRNHGGAATRPCDLHGMPGVPFEDGVMPLSVQAYRLTITDPDAVR